MRAPLGKLLRFLSLFILPAVMSLGFSAGAAQIRVLILSGQNNHEWAKTTAKLKSILENSGRFAIEVTEHPEKCVAADFNKFDAVLSDWNTFGTPVVTNWPDVTRQAFLDFVKSGKGFAVVHAGGSSFYDWPEYQKIAGASWKMGQTSHGAPHEFTVTPSQDHPITRGLAEFRTKDELWVKPGLAPDVKVIATAEGQPIALTSSLGKGKGFTLLLGHSDQFMDTPGFQQLLTRGVEWAATSAVTATSQ